MRKRTKPVIVRYSVRMEVERVVKVKAYKRLRKALYPIPSVFSFGLGIKLYYSNQTEEYIRKRRPIFVALNV